MNKINPFDEHLKNKLADFEADVPAYLWDNINKDNNRKKPFFIWSFSKRNFFLILTITILGGGFYNYVTSYNSNFPFEKTIVSINKVNIVDLSKEKNTIQSEPVIKSNYRNQQKSKNIKVNAASPGIDLIVETPKEIEFSKTQPLLAEKSTRNKKLKKSNLSGLNALSLDESNSIVEKLNEDEFHDNKVLAWKQESILTPHILSAELLHTFSKFTPTLKIISKPVYNIPCPTFNNNTNRFYTDFYAAADIINRQFNDTANSIYLQKRKEGNTISSAFSFGIRLTKLFKSGITIRGGINFSQVNEKFKFTQGNIIQMVYETNASGDTIGSYQTISTRYKITHNQYRNVDFPITIGYEKSFNNWSLGFNGGLIFNLFSTYKGDVLDKNFQPIDINESALEKRYKLKGNIGMGCTGGVSVYYNLTERLKLLAEPYFRYNFSEMNQESSVFKQQYHTIGMRAGIRMDLR